MQLNVPQQTVKLQLTDNGRFMGRIRIGNDEHRIELLPIKSPDLTVEEMIDDLYAYAECGGPLTTTEVDGEEYYLSVMPVGA